MNIYDSISQLKKIFRDEPKRLFLKEILEGSPNLDHIVRSGNAEDMQILIEKIAIEIKNTPKLQLGKIGRNLGYVLALQHLKKLLSQNIYYLDKLFISDKKRARLDNILQKTQNHYKGVVVLPVAQIFDKSLEISFFGQAIGNCFGYIADWAKQILTQKEPRYSRSYSGIHLKGEHPKIFGVDVQAPPPFSPIRFNSKVGKSYPDLNHLHHLNPFIIQVQRIQANQKQLEKFAAEYYGFERSSSLQFDRGALQRFYTSIPVLADKLIKKGRNNVVLNLNLTGYMMGHSLGFCILNDEYHFFDSNTAWFKFKNAADFKNWFIYYCRAIGYSQIMHEYYISKYSLGPIHEKKNINPFMKTCCAPLTGSIQAGWLIYYILIRGGYYLGNTLLNLFREGSSLAEDCGKSSPSSTTFILQQLPPELNIMMKPKTEASINVNKMIWTLVDNSATDLQLIETKLGSDPEYVKGPLYFKEQLRRESAAFKIPKDKCVGWSCSIS